MLVVQGLAVRYGPIQAVRDLSLEVRPGEIVALIGANGAGKTSAVKAIAGLLPHAGSVTLDGRPLPRRAEAALRAGLALVPEGRGILGRMTVAENLRMGGYARRDRAGLAAAMDAAMARFPILGERRDRPAGLLSGGEQQMLAIARALLSEPRVLVLDEPSLGLSPIMGARIFGLIEELRAGGVAVLLVEQKARQVLKVADRAYVLETGTLRASGTAAELAARGLLADAFLGAARSPG
jgi:branched-chain amino acid transport system ATP-binding protein